MSEKSVFDSKGRIMTFKLITDSTADLDEEWANAHDVEILGLTIQLDGKTYETVGENRLTSEILLDSMKNGSKPTTSQVNVGQFEESFRRHVRNGEKVLYLAFSSVLSGTYQSSIIARDIVLEEFPQATIEIVDTLAAAGGEGYLSILAAQARDDGKRRPRIGKGTGQQVHRAAHQRNARGWQSRKAGGNCRPAGLAVYRQGAAREG